MSLAGLLTQTAIVTSRAQLGAVDDRNVPTWTTSVTQGIRCLIQQVDSSEETAEGEETYQSAVGFFPVSTDLDASDTVEVDDIVWEVVGPPNPVWNPRTSSVHHIQAKLREVAP